MKPKFSNKELNHKNFTAENNIIIPSGSILNDERKVFILISYMTSKKKTDKRASKNINLLNSRSPK